ncbi:hypothetical protein Tco_1133737 [Tanacetum coccineum]
MNNLLFKGIKSKNYPCFSLFLMIHVADFQLYGDARDIWNASKLSLVDMPNPKKDRKIQAKARNSQSSEISESRDLHKGYDRKEHESMMRRFYLKRVWEMVAGCVLAVKKTQMQKIRGGYPQREPIWDNATRVTQSNQFVPQAVLLRSGKVSIPAARLNQVPADRPKQVQLTARPMTHLPTPTSSYFQTSTPLEPHDYYNQCSSDWGWMATSVKPLSRSISIQMLEMKG